LRLAQGFFTGGRIRDDYFDRRELLDAEKVNVLDDDGMTALKALATLFFALGQVGDALRPERCGEADDG
jgi:hypothetical protein